MATATATGTKKATVMATATTRAMVMKRGRA
jgi:hypothetical protein